MRARANVPIWQPLRLVLSIALPVLIVDQLSKRLVMATFAPGKGSDVIPGTVSWLYVRNAHGAYGLFGDQPWILIGMAAAVLVVVGCATRDLIARSTSAQVAYGVIVGGALGNIADRLRYGFVIDFVMLRWFPMFQIFNVADACVTFGVAFLFFSSVYALRNRRAPHRSVSKGRY